MRGAFISNISLLVIGLQDNTAYGQADINHTITSRFCSGSRLLGINTTPCSYTVLQYSLDGATAPFQQGR